MPAIRIAWIILACAFAIQFTFSGIHFTFGVFLKPVANDFEWSRGATAFAYTLQWWITSPAALIFGWLSDRIGPRRVLLIGGLIFGLGIFLSGLVQNFWQFCLTIGVLAGIGRSAGRAPLLSAVHQFFNKRKGLAMGITLSGTGVGTLLFPPLVRYVISVADWRTAFYLLGLIGGFLVLSAALFIRGPRPGEVEDAREGSGSKSESRSGEGVLPVPLEGWTVRAVLRSPIFWLFVVTGFACCISHSLPLAHIVAYATDRGIAELPAAGLLGLIGGAAAVGRLFWGFTSDRIGARKTVLCCIIIQTAMIFWLAFTESLFAFYIFAIAYGLGYGGVLPLYAVVTRELFGLQRFGTIYGMHSFGTSMAMGMGGMIGGYIFDVFGDYFPAFIASGTLGLMAVSFAFYLAFLKGPYRPGEERVIPAEAVPARG
jgi:MFS family permease